MGGASLGQSLQAVESQTPDEGVWCHSWTGRIGMLQNSRRCGLELELGRFGPRVVEFGAPHLALSPFPGVHSLRVARGKKVGEAEARGSGPEGAAVG